MAVNQPEGDLALYAANVVDGGIEITIALTRRLQDHLNSGGNVQYTAEHPLGGMVRVVIVAAEIDEILDVKQPGQV